MPRFALANGLVIYGDASNRNTRSINKLLIDAHVGIYERRRSSMEHDIFAVAEARPNAKCTFGRVGHEVI